MCFCISCKLYTTNALATVYMPSLVYCLFPISAHIKLEDPHQINFEMCGHVSVKILFIVLH